MRPPDVFVRELSPDEGNRLERLSKTAKQETKRQRALICWASATRMSVPVIARLVDSDESHVRKVIHAFNERGFQSLDPDWRGGALVGSRTPSASGSWPWLGPPQLDGSPFDALVAAAALGVSEGARGDPGLAVAFGADPARGRAVLSTHAYVEGLADPDYTAKAERVIALCKRPPKGSVVISFDQMGPVSLRPMPGAGWAPRKRPAPARRLQPQGGHPLRVRRV